VILAPVSGHLPVAKAVDGLLVEGEARPFEVAGDEVVVGKHVACAAVEELRELLPIDDLGDFGRNGLRAEAWRPSGDDESALKAFT